MEAMAQRQRVGFQTRRLGVQIPLGSYIFCRAEKVLTHNLFSYKRFIKAYYVRLPGTYLAGA